MFENVNIDVIVHNCINPKNALLVIPEKGQYHLFFMQKTGGYYPITDTVKVKSENIGEVIDLILDIDETLGVLQAVKDVKNVDYTLDFLRFHYEAYGHLLTKDNEITSSRYQA